MRLRRTRKVLGKTGRFFWPAAPGMGVRQKARHAFRRAGIVAGTLTALAGTAEITARVELNNRVAGLSDMPGQATANLPRICTVGAESIKQHFTAYELRMLEGLYRKALLNTGRTSETKLFNRVRAIDAAILASLRTGYPVGMLVTKMRQESALGFLRSTPRSSAQGNLQGLRSTWVEMLYQEIPNDPYYGERYGALAAHIQKVAVKKDGKTRHIYQIRDEKIKKRILDLRLNDPELEAYIFAKRLSRKNPMVVRGPASSSVAIRWLAETRGRIWQSVLMSLPAPVRLQVDGEFARQNEIYKAHLLGDTGAERFNSIGTLDYLFGNVKTYFPGPAESNPELLMDKSPLQANWTIAGRIHGIQRDMDVGAVEQGDLRGMCDVAPFSPAFKSAKLTAG